MFRLQIEENYCLKFKNIMVSYLEKQEKDEMMLANQIRERKMKKFNKAKNIPENAPMKDAMVYNENKEEQPETELAQKTSSDMSSSHHNTTTS